MTTEPSSAWIRRIQALLAKAQSTEFPAEAETLIAKAQELMTRHAIDEAMLAGARPGANDAIVTHELLVEAPYARPKCVLLGGIARANRCQAITTGPSRSAIRRCVLVGHRSDVEHVTTMFAALSLHATRAMLGARVPTHENPRSFRHAFLLAFAHRISERLQEAAATAEGESSQSHGASVALVLRDRQRAVEDAVHAQFPHLRAMRTSASSGAGLASGRAAADRADLGGPAVRGARRGLLAG